MIWVIGIGSAVYFAVFFVMILKLWDRITTNSEAHQQLRNVVQEVTHVLGSYRFPALTVNEKVERECHGRVLSPREIVDKKELDRILALELGVLNSTLTAILDHLKMCYVPDREKLIPAHLEPMVETGQFWGETPEKK